MLSFVYYQALPRGLEAPWSFRHEKERCQTGLLEQFYQGHLRSVFSIQLQERVSNKKFLEASQSISIETMLSSKYPGWAQNQRMLFKGEQWKDQWGMHVTIHEFTRKNRDHYQSSKLWDITVRLWLRVFMCITSLSLHTNPGKESCIISILHQ